MACSDPQQPPCTPDQLRSGDSCCGPGPGHLLPHPPLPEADLGLEWEDHPAPHLPSDLHFILELVISPLLGGKGTVNKAELVGFLYKLDWPAEIKNFQEVEFAFDNHVSSAVEAVKINNLISNSPFLPRSVVDWRGSALSARSRS